MHDPDADWLNWLQGEHARADGVRDGYSGDRIDEHLAIEQPEYRRGLSEGRTRRVDEDLVARWERGEIDVPGEPGPRSQGRKIRAYQLAKARWG